jgi:hypothetical protein
METKEVAADSPKADINLYTIILDKVQPDVKQEDLDKAFKEHEVKYSEISKIEQADYTSFGIDNYMQYSRSNNRNNKPQRNTDHQFFLVRFENKEDLIKMAHNILFDKTIKINDRTLHMMLHNKKGNYNSKTTICIQ